MTGGRKAGDEQQPEWLALMNDFKQYLCVICGFVYDEAKGIPEEGIEPGTRWADVPLTWQCPECGAGKEDFEMVEI